MNVEDKEKQSLLADAVAELQKKATELEQKSVELERKKFAEYDRKFAELEYKSASLEKITKSMQQHNQQSWQHRAGQGASAGAGATDTISYLSFVSVDGGDNEEHDDSTFFSDNPMTSQRNTSNTDGKKKAGGIFGYGTWMGGRDDDYDLDEQEEGNNQGLSLNLVPADGKEEDNKSKEQIEDHTADVVERGFNREEFQLLQEKVASLDKIVNEQQKPTSNNVGGGGGLMRNSLLTRLPSAFLPSSLQDDGESKKSIELDRDSFALMIRAKWYSKPWFLGLVSFMFQISLLMFGPLSYYVTETDILEATLLWLPWIQGSWQSSAWF